MQPNHSSRAAHWMAPLWRALILVGLFSLAMVVLVIAYSGAIPA
jgi:hypothetical protein